jgi:hypothetical protein
MEALREGTYSIADKDRRVMGTQGSAGVAIGGKAHAHEIRAASQGKGLAQRHSRLSVCVELPRVALLARAAEAPAQAVCAQVQRRPRAAPAAAHLRNQTWAARMPLGCKPSALTAEHRKCPFVGHGQGAQRTRGWARHTGPPHATSRTASFPYHLHGQLHERPAARVPRSPAPRQQP